MCILDTLSLELDEYMHAWFPKKKPPDPNRPNSKAMEELKDAGLSANSGEPLERMSLWPLTAL